MWYIKISTIFLLLFIAVDNGGAQTLGKKNDSSSVAITDSSKIFADMIIQSKIPVFVDFWAVWCGPCRILKPIVAELEKKYHKKVLFLKINVDKHKALAAYLGVSAIPTVYIIKNKTVINSFPGLYTKESYDLALSNALKDSSSSE